MLDVIPNIMPNLGIGDSIKEFFQDIGKAILPFIAFGGYVAVCCLFMSFYSASFPAAISFIVAVISLIPAYIMMLYLLRDGIAGFNHFSTINTWNIFWKIIAIALNIFSILFMCYISVICVYHNIQNARIFLKKNQYLLSEQSKMQLQYDYSEHRKVMISLTEEYTDIIFSVSFFNNIMILITLALICGLSIFVRSFYIIYNARLNTIDAIEQSNLLEIISHIMYFFKNNNNSTLSLNENRFLSSFYLHYKTQYNGQDILLKDILFGFYPKNKISDFSYQAYFFPYQDKAALAIIFNEITSFLKPHLENEDIICAYNSGDNYQDFVDATNNCKTVTDMLNIRIQAVKNYIALYIHSRFISDEYMLKNILRAHIISFLEVPINARTHMLSDLSYINDDAIIKYKSNNIRSISDIILSRLNTVINLSSTYLIEKGYTTLCDIFEGKIYNINYDKVINLKYRMSNGSIWTIANLNPEYLSVMRPTVKLKQYLDQLIDQELRNSVDIRSANINNSDPAQQLFSLISTGYMKFTDDPRQEKIDLLFPTNNTNTAIVKTFKKMAIINNLYESFKVSIFDTEVNLGKEYNNVITKEYDIFAGLKSNKVVIESVDFAIVLHNIKSSALYQKLLKKEQINANEVIKIAIGSYHTEITSNDLTVNLEDDNSIIKIIADKYSRLLNNKFSQIGKEFATEAIIKLILCLRRFNHTGVSINDFHHKWTPSNQFQYRAWMDKYRESNANDIAWNIDQDRLTHNMLANLHEN